MSSTISPLSNPAPVINNSGGGLEAARRKCENPANRSDNICAYFNELNRVNPSELKKGLDHLIVLFEKYEDDLKAGASKFLNETFSDSNSSIRSEIFEIIFYLSSNDGCGHWSGKLKWRIDDAKKLIDGRGVSSSNDQIDHKSQSASPDVRESNILEERAKKNCLLEIEDTDRELILKLLQEDGSTVEEQAIAFNFYEAGFAKDKEKEEEDELLNNSGSDQISIDPRDRDEWDDIRNTEF